MEWMFLPLKRYAEFNGRSRRMEYWMFQLMLTILALVSIVIMLVIGLSMAGLASGGGVDGRANGLIGMFASMGILLVLFVIVGLGLFIPTLAVQVRRLHDTDRSGWWVMLYYGPYLLSFLFNFAAMGMVGDADSALAIAILSGLISLLFFGGWITLTVFDCLPGTPGTNKYGPDPLGGFQDLSQTFR